jgi:hypothetical protein
LNVAQEVRENSQHSRDRGLLHGKGRILRVGVVVPNREERT